MEHKTDTDSEREAFESWYIEKARKNIPALSTWSDEAARSAFLRKDADGQYAGEYVAGSWDAFQAGRASLAASAGSEPVAWFVEEHSDIQDLEWNRIKPTYPGNWKPLYTHPSPPEGMVVVPKEPTPEMLDAVDEQVGGHCYSCSKWGASEDDSRRVWAAMIAAAPPIAAGGGKDACHG